MFKTSGPGSGGIRGRLAAGAAAAIAVLAGAACPASAQVEPAELVLGAEVTWPTATNAAPIYWRAFYFYQTNESLKGVDWSEMLAVDDDTGYLLSNAQIEQVRKADDVIATAIRASRVEACNWEIDYDQGVGALLPHLGPLRNLTRLMAVDVRRCVQEDDIQGAVDRLEAMHALARHARGDGILISSLVSCAISSMTAAQTTELLARVTLTAEQQSRLVAAIDAYTEDDPFAVRQAIGNEGTWLTAWLAQEVSHGRLQDQMELLFQLGDETTFERTQQIRRMSDEAFMDDLRSCRRYYTDAVAVWDEADAADRLELIGELVGEGHYGVAARLLAPALGKAYSADNRGRLTLETSRKEILADEIMAPQD